MKQIVFYSWQSDLPNACNRGFIQRALEDSSAAIKADDTVEVEPVVDRDTLSGFWTGPLADEDIKRIGTA